MSIAKTLARIMASKSATDKSEKEEVSRVLFKYCKCVPNTPAPHPRSGHRVVCDDKYLYSYGGYNPTLGDNGFGQNDEWLVSKPMFRELWRYNICTQRWKRLVCENIPKVLASNSVVLSGNLILVFGGTGTPFGEVCSNDLYICDLSKKELVFEVVPTKGDLPEPQYGKSVILDDNILYSVGGTCGYHFNIDIHKLHLETKVWEKIVPANPHNAPEPRYRHEVAFFNGEIFVFGGGTNFDAYSLQRIPVFNLKTKTWRAESTISVGSRNKFPSARKSHSLIQVPEQEYLVIVCGGYDNATAFKDTWMLNLLNMQWKQIMSCFLPKSLYFHDTAVTPSGKMITFGGIKSTHSNMKERCNDVLVAWVRIPTLSELCWDVLLFSNPIITMLSAEDLYNLGIPVKFIMRIIDET